MRSKKGSQNGSNFDRVVWKSEKSSQAPIWQEHQLGCLVAWQIFLALDLFSLFHMTLKKKYHEICVKALMRHPVQGGT